MKVSNSQFHFKHKIHKEILLKFLALVVILAAYFAYMCWKFDASTGLGLALLTWSFFVLCTPVADGGFILAFPVRLLFGVKMAVTQVVVWAVAIGINLYMLSTSREAYELTFLTQLLYQILTEAYPYWSILIISALGTFLSVYFGDEMMDVTTHKQLDKHHQHGFKYKIILVVGMGLLTITAYYFLLSSLNISIPVT